MLTRRRGPQARHRGEHIVIVVIINLVLLMIVLTRGLGPQARHRCGTLIGVVILVSLLVLSAPGYSSVATLVNPIRIHVNNNSNDSNNAPTPQARHRSSSLTLKRKITITKRVPLSARVASMPLR